FDGYRLPTECPWTCYVAILVYDVQCGEYRFDQALGLGLYLKLTGIPLGVHRGILPAGGRPSCASAGSGFPNRSVLATRTPLCPSSLARRPSVTTSRRAAHAELRWWMRVTSP